MAWPSPNTEHRLEPIPQPDWNGKPYEVSVPFQGPMVVELSAVTTTRASVLKMPASWTTQEIVSVVQMKADEMQRKVKPGGPPWSVISRTSTAPRLPDPPVNLISGVNEDPTSISSPRHC